MKKASAGWTLRMKVSREATEVFVVSFTAFMVYFNSLWGDFVYDDSRAIVTNQDLRPETPWSALLHNDYWGTALEHSGSHKSFRPLTVASFRFNFYISGLQPFSYHLVNVLLHTLVSVQVWFLARFRLGISNSFVVAMLFAVHPIHSEAVAGVVGRAELLSAVFFLSALLVRGRILVLCLSFAALLSKEQGLMVLPLLISWELLKRLRLCEIRRPKEILMVAKDVAWLGCGFLVLLFFRFWIMNFEAPSFSPSDNPAANSNYFLTRLLTFAYLPVLNVQLLILPTTLSFDWSMTAVPLIESCFDHRNMITICFYAIFGYYSFRILNDSFALENAPAPKYDINANRIINSELCRNRKCQHEEDHSKPDSKLSRNCAALFGILLTVISFLPATNALAYVGFVVAERVLYIPSIGYCILVGIGTERISRSRLFFFTALTLTFFSLRTISRNNDWLNEESLYRSGISVNPAKAYSNLGNVLSKAGDSKGAESAYIKALQHRPNMADTHYNLGTVFQSQGKFLEAVQAYENAIRFREKLAVAHLNLGLVKWELNELEAAEERFELCEGLSSEGLKDPKAQIDAKTSCLYNLGRLLADEKRYADAISAYERAIAIMQKHYTSAASIYNMLGESYAKIGELDKAKALYLKALHLKPNHIPAHLTMGHLKIKEKKFDEALSWFQKAAAISPNDAVPLQHLGQYYHQTNQLEKSRDTYIQAHDIDPQNFHVTFGLATVYRLLNKVEESERFYRISTELRPTSASAHLNYGAILHLKRDYLRAKTEYLTALELNPKEEMAIENLRKLERILAKL